MHNEENHETVLERFRQISYLSKHNELGEERKAEQLGDSHS